MMSTEDTSANVIRGEGGPHALIRSLTCEPRAVALGLLGIYLAATGLVLGATEGGAGLAIVHGAVLAVVIWSSLGRGLAPRIMGDILPLVAAPVLYAEIPALIAALHSVYHDAAIQAVELAVFGTQPARTFASALPNVVVSEILHAGYLAYYPAIFVPPLLLYGRGERRGYLETVAALTATYLVCWAIFAVAPVEGPRYEWGAATGAPAGPMRSLARAILAAGSSRGAAFPSSHMAVMAAQFVLARQWQRSTSVVVGVIALLVGFGAVYGGFHYATDMVAGAVLGAGIGYLALFAFSKSATRAHAKSRQ